MRSALPLVLMLLLAGVTLAACGGADDPEASLAAACERQIKEVAEAMDAGGATAKSTEEADRAEQLSECAGQPSRTSTPDAAAEDDTQEPADEPADEPTTETETETTDEPAELDAGARELFVSTCAGCHTLADADATGAVGPNLDETKPDSARVAAMIADGSGTMPGGLLEGDDAAAVADYVSAAAGTQ